MEIVKALQTFSFNYVAYDRNASLFVGFNIYDVSTGTPVFAMKLAAVNAGSGVYVGSYTPALNQSLLVIGVVYEESGLTIVDPTRPITAEIYQASINQITFFGWNYAAYDQRSSLSITASIYDMSTGSPNLVHTQAMAYVAFGVYFSSYTGTLGKSYQIVSAPSDVTRPLGCDEFECITLFGGQPTFNNFISGPATLSVQTLSATLVGQPLAAILEEQ